MFYTWRCVLMALEVVSQIKVNGEWIDLDTLPIEEGRKILTQVVDRAMMNIGFVREKNIYDTEKEVEKTAV